MNKIKFKNFLEPFKSKKKFTFFIFISIFLILTFEILLKKIDTKIYVTNIDLQLKELDTMNDSLEYFNQRKNIAIINFKEIGKTKEFRKIWDEAASLVKRGKKNSSYIQLNKITNRSDRYRIQIRSKDIAINKIIESVIYPKFNNHIINLYLEDLELSLIEEKKLEQNYINKVLMGVERKKNEIRNNLLFIETVLEKKIDENKKNELIEQKALEYKIVELKKIENKFNEWYLGHKKTKEKIIKKNFISKEEFEEFISLDKNNIKIKYILQILSFIISYTLVLFYSLKVKDNTDE